jgi:hypothetical protein
MLSNQFESPNEQKLQKGFDIKNCQNLDFVCKISWKFYFGRRFLGHIFCALMTKV